MNIADLPSYDSPTRGYIGWRPGDDYMYSKGDGWNSNLEYATWAEFFKGYKDTDIDLNLVADFFFGEDHKSCPDCENGYSAEAHQIEKDAYDHAGTGRRWIDAITDADFAALKENGRAKEYDSAEAMNRAYKESGGWPVHDGINVYVMVEARCKSLGIPLTCATCGGDGGLKTGAIRLYMWWLHPRKGASRGITVTSVTEADIPQVKEFLRRSFEAHQRHFEWALTP